MKVKIQITDDNGNVFEGDIDLIKAKAKKGKVMLKDTQRKHVERYNGLKGGIRYLINQGVLNQLMSVSEIAAELKRNGYHYPITSIDKILSVDFTKNTKQLNRIKEDGVWRYVIRK
jgi:hypothetical protein